MQLIVVILRIITIKKREVKMSDQYQDEILKDISKNIKDIKQELVTKNKIDSINLVFNLASNDTFKQFTEDEIAKVMPKGIR